MSNVTVIGEGAVVRGRIQGEGDLAIAGRVEGDVEVSGEIVVEVKGLVAANLTGQRVVVRGAVRGDLVGAESIELDAGARVVGDARAPRIRVAPGALIRGFVTTGPREPAATKSRTAAASAARPAPKPAVAPKKVEAPQSAPAAKKAEPPKPVAKIPAKPAAKSAPARGATIAGARPGPPAPVVPALRKGAKAVHKKRA
jgi:cytoskeletal protein CcmA (bactofilin family)